MPAPHPVAYLNDALVQLKDARISPLDRGFLYADSVYEVVPVYAGRPFLLVEHCARLERSLAAIGMQSPHDAAEWAAIFRTLIAANGGGDMYVYVQVSRGAEWGRNHAIPKDIAPTIFAFAAELPPEASPAETAGVSAITCSESRWSRCDIKSTSLLANVLSKSEAADAGATEAIYMADGQLHEGSSSAILVVKDDTIHAPVETQAILPSTSRALILKLAQAAGLTIHIHDVPEVLLRGADEIWMCSATRPIMPVVKLDGNAVGSGKPGRWWLEVRTRFDQYRRDIASLPALAGRN